jgi:hypothetical protein
MSLALNMFSRRSSSLAPRPFAMVPLLLLVLSHPGKELFVASSADDRTLTMRIKALSPTVSLDDARRVTYCAVTTGREMAREWRVIPGASLLPGLQFAHPHGKEKRGGSASSTQRSFSFDWMRLSCKRSSSIGRNRSRILGARITPS